jgi:hypothetical protein
MATPVARITGMDGVAAVRTWRWRRSRPPLAQDRRYNLQVHGCGDYLTRVSDRGTLTPLLARIHIHLAFGAQAGTGHVDTE